MDPVIKEDGNNLKLLNYRITTLDFNLGKIIAFILLGIIGIGILVILDTVNVI